MPRIAGVDIPKNKQVWVSLQYIYGIGPSLSRRILAQTGVNADTKVDNLTEDEVKFYKNQMPGAADDVQYDEEGNLIGGSAKYKLDQMASFFLGLSGVNVVLENPETGEKYVYDDMYSAEQRLVVRQAINNKWLLKY